MTKIDVEMFLHVDGKLIFRTNLDEVRENKRFISNNFKIKKWNRVI